MSAQAKERSACGRDRLAAVLRQSGDLVSAEEVVRSLGVKRQRASQLLARWSEQGWLKRLRQGIYVLVPIDAISFENVLGNPRILVPALFSPGYIGGWSAAEHWGLTDQVFRDVCVFTAGTVRRGRQLVEGAHFSVYRLPQSAIFGTDIVWEERERIFISDPHRTIVDILDRPATGGGIRHVDGCLDAYLRLRRADLDRVVAYADRKGNGAVFKRLGFLLSSGARWIRPFSKHARPSSRPATRSSIPRASAPTL